MTAEQRDPGWRFGDDYQSSAQAEWEHGETRPLQTREEIHNAALTQATNALIEDPGKLWTSGEIVQKLFELRYTIGTFKATGEWTMARTNDEELRDAIERVNTAAQAILYPDTDEESGLTTSFSPGSAESWAMVAIQYLRQRPMQDHPISHLLVDRIRRELTSDVTDERAVPG